MPVMSPPEKKPKGKPTERPKRKPQRTGKSLNVWIQGELRDALDTYVENTKPRTTQTAVVELALEEFLTKAGLWPPPAGSPAKTE